MAHLALYRTFRPKTLDDVVRQEHIVTVLKNQIESGRIGHAYLFCGPRGTGKTSVAKIFAQAINCESPVGGSPCGKCAVCQALSRPENLDINEIDAASNNGVDEMRDLREKVQYPPVAGKYKVYIVDEVHMLTLTFDVASGEITSDEVVGTMADTLAADPTLITVPGNDWSLIVAQLIQMLTGSNE